MEWKNEYSLGIQEIDDQHKALLRSFNKIKEAIRTEQAWSGTHFSILELREHALSHFAVEEAMMRLFGYPETEAHRESHKLFLAKLEDISNSSIRKSASTKMLASLQEWLTNHIVESDKDYAQFILAGATVVRSK
ncbi:MAG: bacteriohemerythrin [Gallionellaceae bacterium]